VVFDSEPDTGVAPRGCASHEPLVNGPIAASANLIRVPPVRLKLALGLACLCSVFGTGATAKPATTKSSRALTVHSQPAQLVNGSPILFLISPGAPLKGISGRWMDHEVFFSFDAQRKAWFGIAGVSLETHAGKYPLAVTAHTVNGDEISIKQRIAIGKGKYRHVAVSVAKKFTEPDLEQLAEIKQERALKEDVFSHLNREREWDGSFVPPVAAAISDVFGTARVFNGETQSMHQGLDYAVPSGTPVKALNRGNVLLARPLFFEGNCVVIDHGQGLLSLYMHLSKLEVKEGEQVTKAQEIALSGGTGRATGPHLHIAVRWQGIYVNPATLMDLKLP
jgi:murein DD-endopeptidase MepM/ murein hydrolase activator NlpD